MKSPWANLCFGGFLTFGTTVGQRGSCWHGFTKKNLKWHICITNDDSYCAHGHTRTNRCVNGYICMYVCSRSLLVHIVGVSLAGTLEDRRPRETVGFTNSQCFIKTLGVEKKGEP